MKTAHKFNNLVRELFSLWGENSTWYYNDAQHWRRNRRKVFKIYVGDNKEEREKTLRVCKQVLNDLNDLCHEGWELYETTKGHGCRCVGIKKYEPNEHYTGCR